jgi:hypothetical protein
MWPFPKKPSAAQAATAIMDEAIGLTAERWHGFTQSVAITTTAGLRQQIAVFARQAEADLRAKYRILESASDPVMLLIIAKGVQESGTFSRRQIEEALGITLPR